MSSLVCIGISPFLGGWGGGYEPKTYAYWYLAIILFRKMPGMEFVLAASQSMGGGGGGGGVHMPPVPLGSYTYGVFTINLDSIYFGSRTELQSTITFGCGFESIRTGGCSHLRRILVNVD